MSEFLELTKENLYQKYIVENTRLADMPKYFDARYNTIRTHLEKNGIKKSQKMASENGKRTYHLNHPEGRPNPFLLLSPERQAEVRARGAETKKATTLKQYASEGITYEKVYELFITQNKSITAVGEVFDKTKSQMRTILKTLRIPAKTPELRHKAQVDGITELYSDPVRGPEKVKRGLETSRDRYADDWYYKNASQPELEIVAFIEENFPQLEVINGAYNVIRHPEKGGALQLDIWLPELKLAFEFNGEYWHDREAFENDEKNGTVHSREMIKTQECAKKNIQLVHHWDSEWKIDKTLIFAKVKAAVEKQYQQILTFKEIL